MSNITVTHFDKVCRFKSFVFPGGEVGIKFDKSEYGPINCLTFTLKAKSAHDLIELAMVKDAAKRQFGQKQSYLKLSYIPYARQDRVCDEGEAFSLKVFCDYLNFLSFDEVEVMDPHSNVAPALINNVKVISQEKIIHCFYNLQRLFLYVDDKPLLVSPDDGASKKVAKLAASVKYNSFVRCEKVRDLSTGKIIKTEVHEDEPILGRQVCIVDDICDGGATFIELAKVLRAKGASVIHLYVTHGIFSRGIQHLYDNGIDYIWTTDSLMSREYIIENRRKYGDKFNIHEASY